MAPGSHDPSPDLRSSDLRLPAELRRVLVAVVAVFLLATVVGMVVLWPPATTSSRLGAGADLGTPVDLVNATVLAAPAVPCRSGLPGAALTCRDVTARLDNGPEKGQTTALDITEGPDQPTLRAGDKIVLGRAADPVAGVAYYFSDYQRRAPLLALGLLFAVAVVGLARWRGAAALLGLGASLLVLVRFVLPAILAGRSAVAVAVVGSSLIAVVIIYLAHGVSARTTTAVLGTLMSLGLTAVLAVVFVELTQLTGLSSEEGTYLRGLLGGQVNLRGLLLAGIVIGALGVLNDVTVTQASAVWEIYLANPSAGARQVYRSAMRIGRDHIASTVDTLVLAYAGAAMPLLVVFTVAGRRLGDVITGEVVAAEVVQTLIGSLGLVAAVPVTTGLAALLVTRTVPRRGGPDGRGAGRALARSASGRRGPG
ncbi:MAG: YibE/F family protein, partial [Actinomycetota bacterium]|nr:YibE/F family protein [Actinomycetota bacterium]